MDEGSKALLYLPSTNPGDCWAIKGQEASAVIKLATMIEVENVSLDHIHKSLAPLGDTSSAPNKFSVWGLDSQTCDHRHLFGIFCYNNDGSAVQTFQVKNKGLRPYNIIELKVHSNHGNPKYTCIYKIRVHGKKSSSSGITVHS
ncbi:SUN domain-containing protein 3-like [Lycorma delicatula]|uniref:SUN domain-containing protein 3-like n=1 Tax=Lycorma delicatula TaxID=130591 RepID=UPI003F518D36